MSYPITRWRYEGQRAASAKVARDIGAARKRATQEKKIAKLKKRNLSGFHGALPEIGTVWMAKDGRELRLTGWTRPDTYPLDDFYADFLVLNRTKGMRRKTTIPLWRFRKFLTPITPS